MLLEWQLKLLEELRVARLGTIAPSGVPHLVPVCYAFTDGALAIAIDEKPKRTTQLARLANIQRDPRVSILFDRYANDWAQLAWVRVDGEAEVIPEGRSWDAALRALRLRYEQYCGMELEARPVIRIRPATVVGWRHGVEPGDAVLT